MSRSPSPPEISRRRRYRGLTVREMVIFAMLGALMFASKIIMEALPNIHLLGLFVVTLTVVYRRRALYPIYTFVFLQGAISGFNLWWVPYLYVWTVLWAAVMLLPRRMPPPVAAVVYAVVSALHGLLFGVLYAPFQSLMFGLDGSATLAWIASGFWFDVIHAISNLCTGVLILPLCSLLRKLEKQVHR